jgi:2-isopropylmalate synthase
MKKVYIYDTTLRDGAQTEGISYSLKDKIQIAEKLDWFGVDYIEGGWPFSNPKDQAFFDHFKTKKLKNTKLVPFGSTAHPKNPPSKDKNLKSLVDAGTEYVAIFGKTWDHHVKKVLKISLEDNLEIIRKSVAFLAAKGKKVFYDAEHFFDGYKKNPQYALKTIKAAIDGGCESVVFCDTNGGTLTWEIKEITAKVKDELNLGKFAIHCHNDLGLGVVNSLVSLDTGCNLIQGTINGYGERCGNADLVPIIGILQLKMNYQVVPSSNLKRMSELSHFVSEVSNMIHRDNYPFVGRSAFAHKGGVHIDAVLKSPASYEHLDPHLVGNKRRFLVSEFAGKSSLVTKAKELEYDLDKKSRQAKELHELLQKMEREGYQFEAADGSFKLLLEKKLKKHKTFFEIISFRVIIEENKNKRELTSEATVKVKVGDNTEHTVAEGDGPVNALDNALRKALEKFYPSLQQMHLADFKVRVLNEEDGTAAKVRVLVNSQDKKENWSTIGVSENIIEASWEALLDSIEYKLLRDSKNKGK